RKDDVQAGRVGLFSSYSDPTANAQSALATRLQMSVRLEKVSDAGKSTVAGWLQQSNFRLRENFTGYLQRSEQQPLFIGRGYLIEQEDHDLAFGFAASHRTPRLRPAS